MTADCNVVCGSWGQGLAAFDRLFEAMPYIGFALLFVGAIWIISSCRG